MFTYHLNNTQKYALNKNDVFNHFDLSHETNNVLDVQLHIIYKPNYNIISIRFIFDQTLTFPVSACFPFCFNILYLQRYYRTQRAE